MSKLKFNDYVKTFPHEIFGDLTTIKSHKEDDTFYFIGKEIQEILGFKDMWAAIENADLDADEFLILEKKKDKRIFNDFIDHFKNKVSHFKSETPNISIITKYTPTLTLIKESGLYGLAMSSRKPIAKEFRRAIRKDILPGVRKLFETYKEFKLNTDIVIHLDEDYQKINSRWFNYVTYNLGGKYNTINENIRMSRIHTGIMPNVWKSKGKKEAEKRGIPPSKIVSGLDGMRLLKGEESCAISQHKQLLKMGLSEEKAFKISENTKESYRFMIENGVVPNELFDNKKNKRLE